MDRVSKLNSKRYCADPFKIHKKKKISKCLRDLTQDLISINRGLSLTLENRVCVNCFYRLTKTTSLQPKALEPSTSPEESDLESNSELTNINRAYEMSNLNTSLPIFEQSPFKKCRVSESKQYSKLKFKKAKVALRRKIEIATGQSVSSENEDTETEILQQLKEKYNKVESRSEKLVILTVLPKSWSRQKIINEFKCSQYTARQAKTLVKEKGVLSTPNPKISKSNGTNEGASSPRGKRIKANEVENGNKNTQPNKRRKKNKTNQVEISTNDSQKSINSKTLDDENVNALIKKEESDVLDSKLDFLPNLVENDTSAKPNKSKKMLKKVDIPVSVPIKYNPLGCGPPVVPFTGKRYVGCHVSAAGGIWNCFANGKKSNASSIALFLRNQRSWNAKPLDQDSIDKWNEALKDFPPHLILPHGSYLMNLGSPKPEVLDKSRLLFVEELQRCERLGIPHFNFHPGSTLGEISREECCQKIAESINLAHEQTSIVVCVIENMSKQGFTIGGDFNEIRLIIEKVKNKSRVGVCIDTCHAHAAGYDLAKEEGFNLMVSDFEKIIGWQFLRGLHVNDSKGKAGDHKDRHELIGKGYIGCEGFKRIMNFPKFVDIPLILETPFVSEEEYGKEIKLLENMTID